VIKIVTVLTPTPPIPIIPLPPQSHSDAKQYRSKITNATPPATQAHSRFARDPSASAKPAAARCLEHLADGSAGRWIALLGMCVGGLVLAVLLIPHFSAWTAPGAFAHHH